MRSGLGALDTFTRARGQGEYHSLALFAGLLVTLRLCAKRQTMTDRSSQFRNAVDCLQFARHTSDPRNRATLLLMAQIWFDRADGSPSLDAAVGFSLTDK